MIAVLILAAGKMKPELQAIAGSVTNRALIPVGANGETMLDLVVAAVRGGIQQTNGEVAGRILVAGDVPLPEGCVAVDGGNSLVDTLLSGVAALKPEETRLLVVTADIPFLTPEAVADFLKRALDIQSAQFVYPIVEMVACKKRFPEMKRTTLKILEGEFTGGNIALLDPAFLRKSEIAIRAAYDQRKNVPALAGLLGIDVILRLIGSRVVPSLLTIPHIEKAVGRLLNNGTARAVITSYAEIGTDVDRPEDIQIARRIFQSPSLSTKS